MALDPIEVFLYKGEIAMELVACLAAPLIVAIGWATIQVVRYTLKLMARYDIRSAFAQPAVAVSITVVVALVFAMSITITPCGNASKSALSSPADPARTCMFG